MIAIPFCKVLNKDNGTSSKEENEEFIKRIHQRKVKVQSIALGQKKIHQGEIRFWESIKLWEKKNDVAADVAQRKSSCIKHYASAFSNI